MKILLSDVHGNLAALDAVLEDIRLHSVDLIVNLGDILSGALCPSETADRLMPLGLPTIRGSHERQVLADDLERVGQSDRWALDHLRPDQLDSIASLPSTLSVGEDVLLVHGTPEDDLTYLLETVTHADAGRRRRKKSNVAPGTRLRTRFFAVILTYSVR